MQTTIPPTSDITDHAPPPGSGLIERGDDDFPKWLKVLACVAVAGWALGAGFSEALSQGAEALCILVGAIGLFFGPPIEKHLKPVIAFALALGTFQALSPFIAMAQGLEERLPRDQRYWQFFDSASVAFLLLTTRIAVPWKTLKKITIAACALNATTALFQHFDLWTEAITAKTSFHANPERLRENFGAPGGPIRRAGMGLYYHRLKLAHTATAFFGIPLSLAFGSTSSECDTSSSSDGSNAKRLKCPRRCLVILCLIILGVIWLTYARAALGTALVMAALGVLLLRGKKALLPLMTMFLLAAALVAISPSWNHRFQQLSQIRGGLDRQFAWNAATVLASEHPITGVGFGYFHPAIMRKITPPEPGQRPSKDFHRALASQSRYLNRGLITIDGHNLPLTIFAETGLIGLILFALTQFSMVVALWKNHRSGNLLATGALLSLVGFHILGTVHYLPFHTGVYLAFNLIWGLGMTQRKSANL